MLGNFLWGIGSAIAAAILFILALSISNEVPGSVATALFVAPGAMAMLSGIGFVLGIQEMIRNTKAKK